jgi:ubiquinone/menaquinone biosynthesis C-methylase UbiE
MYQPKIIKNLYTNQESSNYNLNKNFFYYLKQIILLNFIFNLKKFFYKKKDILDYGCGSGELAIALSLFFKNKNIFTADVFKLDKKFIPKIKKHYLLHKGQLKNKKFNLILMRHVFEHILDLDNFLKKIKKNLKNKDSNLIIEVPNLDSLWRKIMKERWPGYFYPFHYYVFSKQFLKDYLSKNNFKVIGEQNLEPAIIGSYLLTFGINKSICKLLSLIFYPLQFLISKIFLSSEAILIIVKKK